MDTNDERAENECPTCGPTTAEPHPRRPGVARCGNCKEQLHSAEHGVCFCHGEGRPHQPHQPCDKGCQPDWHRDDCAIYLLLPQGNPPREIEGAIKTLARIDRENAINCTGPGEVGCYGRKGWHSWSEHRLHVAAAQIAALLDAGMALPPGKPWSGGLS